MAYYQDLTEAHLTREGIHFSSPSENRLRIAYNGDNLKTIPIIACFDKDGDPYVYMYCWEIVNGKGKREQVINACNEINAKYRWAKFYVDGDDDVCAQVDAKVDESNCGEIVLEMVRRMVNIIDEAYPTIMKSLWS